MSGETIYSWIKPAPVVPEKPALYRSKVPEAHLTSLVGSTVRVAKASHAHMGAHLKLTVKPERFLRAHEKDTTLDPYALPKPFHLTSNLPPVPRRGERPLSLPPTGKDFVQENAIGAVMAPLRSRATAAPVNWLKTETFGRRPAYLDHIKEWLESERDLMVSMLDQHQMESEHAGGGQAREMDDDERAELLDALKRKWDTVSAAERWREGDREEGDWAARDERTCRNRRSSSALTRFAFPAPPSSLLPQVNDKYQVISHRKISTSNSTKGEVSAQRQQKRRRSVPLTMHAQSMLTNLPSFFLPFPPRRSAGRRAARARWRSSSATSRS